MVKNILPFFFTIRGLVKNSVWRGNIVMLIPRVIDMHSTNRIVQVSVFILPFIFIENVFSFHHAFLGFCASFVKGKSVP